jgi:hypothetical protein
MSFWRKVQQKLVGVDNCEVIIGFYNHRYTKIRKDVHLLSNKNQRPLNYELHLLVNAFIRLATAVYMAQDYEHSSDWLLQYIWPKIMNIHQTGYCSIYGPRL